VPFGPFLRNVAQLRIVPSRVSREELSKRTVGSGPYRVTEHVEGSHFTMERFDQYWGPKPSIARVTFRIVPEASARVAEIQAGRADIVMPLVPELVPVVERTQGYKVVQAPTTYRIAMTYNTRLDTPVRNPKVRQALNHAINHDAIIRNVLGGFGRKSGPLIEQDLGYNRFFKDFPYDPAKARALLAEAGFPNGFSVVLATSQGRYVKDKEVSEAIAGMYREVGVNARVQVNEWGAHVAQIVNHTISPIYLIGWRGVNFDPSAALIAWDCASAFSNHCNPQIQESLKIGLTSVTPHRRAAAYQNALSTYLTDPHAAYVFQEIGLYAVRATVRWTPRVDQVVLVKTVTMQ
jgi:peptide/nickel transport system substrate-binding protein